MPAHGRNSMIIGIVHYTLAFFITQAGLELPIAFAIIDEWIRFGIATLLFFSTSVRTSDIFVFWFNLARRPSIIIFVRAISFFGFNKTFLATTVFGQLTLAPTLFTTQISLELRPFNLANIFHGFLISSGAVSLDAREI